ncbi:MAG: RusA family crossover junction endodeoxyribonuclease [Chlorobium phaeovibrioides]|nr:RusA family crossover junction endodeoxyribonuclease [Chlorobium phaeovibrioides]
MQYEFIVPGTPQALKRHRTFRRGAHNIQVDPSAIAKETFLLQALEHRPPAPLREALAVTLQFCFARPKSHFRGKSSTRLKADAPHWHTGRPDTDNLAKFVMDSLNGTFWHDDSCIAKIDAEKVYHTVPGIYIRIESAPQFSHT